MNTPKVIDLIKVGSHELRVTVAGNTLVPAASSACCSSSSSCCIRRKHNPEAPA